MGCHFLLQVVWNKDSARWELLGAPLYADGVDLVEGEIRLPGIINFMWEIPFFFFFGHPVQLVESLFPDQDRTQVLCSESVES